MSESQKTERPVPHPFDYVTRDQIQDLWGIGYTIVKRARHVDPFHVPPEMVPQGRSYQWWHLVQDQSLYQHTGWAAVPASRHDGYFMPFGHVGPIEVGGLGLFEKPKFEVDQERAAQIAAAKKQTEDWAKQVEKDGLSGSFSIGGTEITVGKPMSAPDEKTKTINTTVGVPTDMFPHMNEVFAERDRLYAELQAEWGGPQCYNQQQADVMKKYNNAMAADPAAPKGPTLNALLLPYAVANVRAGIEAAKVAIAKLKEGKTDE